MRIPASAAVPAPVDAPERVEAAGLLHPLTLHLPHLPAALADFTLLHVSDLHIRRRRPRFERLLRQLDRTEVDLLLLTGDFMTRPGDEPAAQQMLGQLTRTARTRHGIFGVWGNHDTPRLRRRCRRLPVRWLDNDAAAVDDLPLTVLGVDCGTQECRRPEGCLPTAIAAAETLPSEHFRLLLAHVPTWLGHAAEAGLELMLAGHTHGGQIRLPWLGTLVNATPGWPLRLTSGLIRQRDTYAVISRGIGESFCDGLRFRCPPHAPLITLRNGASSPPTDRPRCVMPW